MKRAETDAAVMEYCLFLAQQGSRWVSPNPMVGCVIVKEGRVVGEGYHRRFGGPHAEVYALQAAGSRSRGATLYVNLEPCAHFGKTPPCVDSIIAAGIREVVIASQDPNPLVRGRGIRRLREAGVRVRMGAMRAEAERLNERFFTFMRTGVPFVGVKLATTLDGRLADREGRSKWITGAGARKLVHVLRSEYDAVLVGSRTAAMDDPELTVRHVRGRNPVRVILDGSLTLPAKRKVFRTAAAETMVVTSIPAARRHPDRVKRLVMAGVHVVSIGQRSRIDPRAILQELGESGISSVLIEGGAETASLFLKKRLVDRVHLFLSPKILGEGLPAVAFENRNGLAAALPLIEPDVRMIGEDISVTARLARS